MLLLAPMEGLLDATLRDVLTRLGGVDRCTSEFIRITNTLLPERAFIRVVPELLNGGRTAAGVPVRPQLLGSDPILLGENAARLATLNPPGIDLNFGCPAKTVNNSRGGAVLLDEPELVGRIVAAVRRAVPAHIPVSAKMRLGYMDDARAGDNALAITEAGANELVIHARTAGKLPNGRDLSRHLREQGIRVSAGDADAEFMPQATPVVGEIVIDKPASGCFTGTGMVGFALAEFDFSI